MGYGLVSVIIPAYNAERYIKTAVKSVLCQTYQNLEVIVVDDASSDGTTEVVRTIPDSRVKLIRHDRNKGPGAARNTGIAACSPGSKWLALLDADDEWLPQRLEFLLSQVQENDQRFFVADEKLGAMDTDEGLIPWAELKMLKGLFRYRDSDVRDVGLVAYLRGGAPVLQPIVPLQHIRRYGVRYNETARMGEDFEFYVRLFQTGLTLRACRQALYLYRVNPESLTRRPDVKDDLIRVYERLLDEEWADAEVPALLRRWHSFARLSADINRRQWGNAARVVTANPDVIRAVVQYLPMWIRNKTRGRLVLRQQAKRLRAE